ETVPAAYGGAGIPDETSPADRDVDLAAQGGPAEHLHPHAEPETGEPADETAAAAPAPRPAGVKRRRTGTLAIAAALILLIGAGAYAYWLNPDRVTALFGTSTPVETVATEEGDEAVTAVEEEAPPAEAAETAETAPAEADAEKFTQRLLPDGSEVDEGPAGEQRRIGEGTSVATSTGTSDEQPA